MSRVVLTTLGSLGDLHPLMAIGLELRQRGHTVVFATSETYRAKIENLGFEFRPMRPDLAPENPATAPILREIMNPKTGTERLLRGILFPQIKATYSDLLAAVTAAGGADLLLSGELVYAAPLIAAKTGIRWASCVLAPMSFFSIHDLPILPPFPKVSRFLRRWGAGVNGPVIRLIKLMTRRWSQPVRDLRSELGLPPGNDPIYEGKHSPDLVLALFSPSMGQPQPDWPSNTVVTGFAFYDASTAGGCIGTELDAFLNAGEPPIVFTLGSAAVLDPGTFYQVSAHAASRLKRRAVLVLGKNPPPQGLPNHIFAGDYIPFSAVFNRSAVIVHQGGIGTTGQALRAGRPMIIMPYNFDQPDNAARLVQMGVGHLVARHEYSVRRVAEHLQQLLHTPGYRQRAEQISHRVRYENGARLAAEALERILPGGH